MQIHELKKTIKSNSFSRLLFYPLIFLHRAIQANKLANKTEVIKNFQALISGSPIFQLNDFKGVFELDPRSDLFSRLMLSGSYESELLQCVAHHINPEKDAVDVGANVGFYTCLLAKTIGKSRKVLAVEPTANALSYLRRNININNIGDQAEIFEGILSDTNGVAHINTIPGREEYSSIGKLIHPAIQGEEYFSMDVVSTTLDTLVPKRKLNPGFIKIDVEGAEHLVLKGSEKVLSDCRPIILSEFSDSLLRINGSSGVELVNFLKSFGYNVYDPLYPKAAPGKYGNDILCFPEEMMVRL